MEQTLVVVKPDGVARGLIGEIIRRFERVGLKVVASKMMHVSKEHAEKHYPKERDALWRGIGQKTLDNYAEMGVNPKDELGTDDPYEIGHNFVRVWLHKYITEGPVFAMVLEGPHAVELVRRITGHTLPVKAASGTIRGDFSFDSSFLANSAKRPIRNLIHASGDLDEAKYEVDLWFDQTEIVTYKRADEDVMKG